MAVAVGPPASGKEGEGVAGVTTQIPGAAQADGTEEEERQDECLAARRRLVVAPMVVRGERGGQGGPQRVDQPGFLRRGEEEQTARPLPPAVIDRLPRRQRGRIFPPRPGDEC